MIFNDLKEAECNNRESKRDQSIVPKPILDQKGTKPRTGTNNFLNQLD